MTVPIPRGLSFLKVALVVVAIVATACQQAATTSPTPGGSATPAASASAAAKRTITVIANWGGGERDAFQKVIDAFTAKTGIPVNYEQSRNLEALVRTRVAGGNPPDIAFEPRPGALAEFAKGGNLIPLDEPVGKEVLDPKAVDAALGKSFQDLGRVNGTLYGFLFKADSKSTFWYKPKSLEAIGKQTPKTWDDLIAVADAYKKAGKSSFGSGRKDGWVLTDWFENIYARVATPKQYNDLHVSHKVPWTDPTVKKALTTFAQIFGTQGYFPGGAQGVVGTAFTEGIAQAFGKNPTAEMFYEGGFVDVIISTDVNKDLKLGGDFEFTKLQDLVTHPKDVDRIAQELENFAKTAY